MTEHVERDYGWLVQPQVLLEAGIAVRVDNSSTIVMRPADLDAHEKPSDA